MTQRTSGIAIAIVLLVFTTQQLLSATSLLELKDSKKTLPSNNTTGCFKHSTADDA
jgi:hypothetical protein